MEITKIDKCHLLRCSRLSTPTAETARPPSAFADVPSTLFSTLSSNKYFYLSRSYYRTAKTAAYHRREITDFKLRYPRVNRAPRFRLHSGSRYKSLNQNPALSTSTVFRHLFHLFSLTSPFSYSRPSGSRRLPCAAAVTFDLPLREASPRPA